MQRFLGKGGGKNPAYRVWSVQVLSDQPESADQYEFSVEDGDVILVVGVFDIYLYYIYTHITGA